MFDTIQPPRPVVDALRVDPHGPLGLGQGALQVLPGGLQVVSLVNIPLQLRLQLRPPERLQHVSCVTCHVSRDH